MTSEGKEVTKIKGFTLNYKKSKILKFDGMKKIVEEEIYKVNLNYKMITGNVENKPLVNAETSKDFKFEYDKRMIIPEKDKAIETLLWGY